MITLLNLTADAWWSWMGAMLWQASLLILIVSLIDLLIGRWAWPQVRYALWLLVLAKLLIPPTWGLPTSVVSWSVPWAQERVVRLWDGEQQVPVASRLAEGTATPAEAGPSETRPTPPGAWTSSGSPDEAAVGWRGYALVVWVLGMGLFLALLARRIAKLRRWHRQQDERQTIPPWFHELMVQTARRLGLERLPAIVFSDEAVTPAVYGVFRPVLLLPAGYTDSLSRAEAEHVLLHELAHLKRGDLWLHGLCLLLQIVYWFHPLMFWVHRRMKHVRELCCDLTVANLLREKTRQYRKTLLNTARELLTESMEPGMGLLGVFEEPFRLVARLRWLEKDTWRNRRWMMVTAGLVVIMMVSLVVPMAPASPPAAPERGPASPAATPARAGSGDLYVRDETRVDAYFLFIPTASKLFGVGELWVGDRRAAIIEDQRTMILDRERGVFIFINPRTRTYVEAPLPLDLSGLLSDELIRQRRHRRYSGRVTPTGETIEVLGRTCREFDIVFWEEHGTAEENHGKSKVWTTTDVSCDLDLVEELLDCMRMIHNRDETVREELHKVRGIQMRWEMKQSRGAFGKRWSSQAVEMVRKEPPPGTYEVPEGYTRKEKFTPEDF